MLFGICASSPELKLINGLNKHFSFDYNIFLLDESIDASRFFDTTERLNTPQSVYKFKRDLVEIEISGLNPHEIKNKDTFVIVYLGSAGMEENRCVLQFFREILKFKKNVKFGIFYANSVTFSGQELKDLFESYWKKLIISIFAVVHTIQSNDSLNIFTYSPFFGTFKVINVTDESYDNFFLRQNSNFQQSPVAMPDKGGTTFRHKFWHEVFAVMNASTVNDPNAAINGDNMFVVAQTDNLLLTLGNSAVYPFEAEYWILIVPEALPYDGFVAYLQAVTTGNVFIFLFITIAATIIFLCYFRFKRESKFSIFQSAADVLGLLMNDNGYINYRRLSNIEVMLIVPLTFAGLIIVNGLLSALQSHFTRPIIQPQIESAEEILNSTFCISTSSNEWEYELIFEVNQI